MTLRLLIYLAKTYQQYLIDTQQSEHSSAKVSLPKPELYVIYTGDDRKSVPSEISFKEDYFDGDAPVDMKVKILCKEDTTTISGQYIGFCKVYNQQKALHNDSIKCAEETVKICIKKGYLATGNKTKLRKISYKGISAEFCCTFRFLLFQIYTRTS